MANKNLKVIVKDTAILELAEDGKVGDQIDLNNLVTVDPVYLNNAINLAKDAIYQKQLQEEKAKFEANKTIEVNELKNQIAALETAKKNEVEMKEKDLETKYQLQIQQLQNQLENVKKEFDDSVKAFKTNKANEISSLNSDKELAISKLKAEDAQKYNALKNELDTLKATTKAEQEKRELEVKNTYESQLAQLRADLEALKKSSQAEKDNLASASKKDIEVLKAQLEAEKAKAVQEVKDDLTAKLTEKENQVAALQNQKARMNVKQIGEDLESYCNSMVLSYMENGFQNCTWVKDNDVVRDPGEEKGSKADYIFKVYADENKKDEQLLTSVCMDMKDENPDSVNRQTNEHYFKALDKNRTKKNCKYAVLVSNLELDKNMSEITKVREYKDMYIVRPGYLMIFLNMVTSLSNNFRDLVLAEAKEQEAMKTVNDLNAEYEALQKTYLDAPLEALEKRVADINTANEAIVKATDKIRENTRKITDSYIEEITKKLEKFGKGLKKVEKGLEGLED